MSPALLQADCALSALPPSRLPGLPTTFAVLWYSGVVPAIVFIFAIVLVPIPILTLSGLAY